MLRRIVRDPRNLPFVIAVLAAVLVVPEIPSPVMRPTAGWRGRYVVLYQEAAAHVVEAALAAAAPGSVSRTGATVRIDAFSEIEVLPVRAVEARLDPLDPRMDAWLSGVHRYFQADDGTDGLVVAYVPATSGRIASWLRFARAFRAAGVPWGSWHLLELEPITVLSVPAAAIAFACILAWRLRRGFGRSLRYAALGVFVWLPGLVNGGAPDLFLCCTALYFWIPHALDGAPAVRTLPGTQRPGSTAVLIGVLLAVAIVTIAAADAAVYRVARMSTSLVSLGMLTELAVPIQQLSSAKRKGSNRFVHVPIRTPRRQVSPAPLAALLAAMLVVTVPVIVSRLRIPLPRPASLAHADSWSGIEAAARAGDADRLPGLSEAVGHAASLQTIAFGGADGASVSFPPRDGRVLLREYSRAGVTGTLLEVPRTVVRFDPGWLERIVDGSAPGSVERLLVEQRRAVAVRVRPPWTALLEALPAALACLLAIAASCGEASARRLLIRHRLWAITDPARSRRTR
jgi:hypothetical protein